MKRKDGTPFIIAEIGGNHEGDFELAKDLLTQAAEAGADSVKFQIYTGDGIVNRVLSPDRAAHFDRFALTKDQYFQLYELANKYGVDFNASIWNLDLISEFRHCLSFIKVGSGDLTTYQFLRELLSLELPIVLSTGLANLDEIEKTVSFMEREGSRYGARDKLTILQCTSMYPIDNKFANLMVLNTLKQRYPQASIGFSDHTRGSDACKLAIALGAEVLEVHFTDKSIKSDFRDHIVSLDADEVRSLREYALQTVELLGDGDKKLTDIEFENEHHISFRRALYMAKDMKAGDIVSASDIISLRPNQGISADKYDDLLGKTVKKNIVALHPLSWDDFV